MWRWMRGLQGRTPPGPRGWPLMGNMLEFPTQYPWIVFREWNMMFLRLLNTQMLRRSAIYSDKPIFPMDALLGWDRNLGLMPMVIAGAAFALTSTNTLIMSQQELPQCTNQGIHDFYEKTLATIILDIVYGHEVAVWTMILEINQKASSYFVEGKALGGFGFYGAEARP
ncbi:hypothetical protein BC629DRAFT_1532106 [Irpex lacteus]|nr:hypothetical protein BC629DRAFT_1532106 [Irpex lacteus]